MLFNTKDKPTLFFQVISVSIAIVILVLGCAYGAWTLFFSQATDGEGFIAGESTDIDSGNIEEDLNIIPGLSPDGVNQGSDGKNDSLALLQANIKNWMNNGVPARDDNVTNILLIGMDLETPNMQTNSRADAMVIFSLNHETKKITLASIMRDQYSYISSKNHTRFEKLHHANAYGGPALQIQMLEKHYKVAIDNYAIVNFYSLPIIIDALGGVDIEVTKTEADYMNTYWGTRVPVGKSTLSGADALIYMRIRHQTGGDSARVMRQQNVIKEILSKLKVLDKGELLSLVTKIVPYLRTGYTSNQMLSLAADAVVNGWFSYQIVQTSFPDEASAKGFTVLEHDASVWYWKVDYPVAAQKLQLLLYGKTNITLNKNRTSWLK